MPRASHKRARTPKGWAAAKPKTVGDRRELLARCGKRAFLLPSKLKFPIMPKTGPCVVDCRAVRAAKQRASQYGYAGVVRAADRIACRRRCRWSGC